MDENSGLLGVVRELYAKTAYSHKTHEKLADWLEAVHRFWYWSDVVLIAVGATGFITQALVGLPKSYSIIAALANTLAVFVTLYTLKSDAEKRIAKHRETANELWLVRERLLNLQADLFDGAISEEDARSQRDELTARLNTIYSVAPHTNSRSYEMAQKALKHREDLTFTPGEIDQMLPPALRLDALPQRKEESPNRLDLNP